MSREFCLTLNSLGQDPTNFTIEYPKTIALNDPKNWKVGLAELRYEPNWLVLPSDQYIEYIYYDKIEKKLKTTEKQLILQTGSYTGPDIINSVNQAFSKYCYNQVTNEYPILTNDIKVTKEPEIYLKNGKVICITGCADWNSVIFPRFSQHLANILGIPSYTIDYYANYYATTLAKEDIPAQCEEIIYGKHLKDNLQLELDSFYVMSNICATIINNKHTNILRQVNVAGEYKLINSYNDKKYTALSTGKIKAVNIKLCRNRDGDLLPFIENNSSITEVVLHFKYIGNVAEAQYDLEELETPCPPDNKFFCSIAKNIAYGKISN